MHKLQRSSRLIWQTRDPENCLIEHAKLHSYHHKHFNAKNPKSVEDIYAVPKNAWEEKTEIAEYCKHNNAVLHACEIASARLASSWEMYTIAII